MEFSKSVIDIIKARKSVRSYNDSLLNEAEKIKILNFLNLKQKSPLNCCDCLPVQITENPGARYFLMEIF